MLEQKSSRSAVTSVTAAATPHMDDAPRGQDDDVAAQLRARVAHLEQQVIDAVHVKNMVL